MFEFFLKTIGKLHAPFAHKKVTGMDFLKFKRLLKDGDILVSKTRGEASNLLTFFSRTKHVAMFLNGKIVAESTAKGVHTTILEEYFFSKDCIYHVRSKKHSSIEIKRSIVKAYSLLGKPYDWQIALNNIGYYCSEYVWVCLKYSLPEYEFIKRRVFFKDVILPDDFIKATKFFEVVGRYGEL